ncbi:hypothetical protein ISN75_10070 [Dyella marensis]
MLPGVAALCMALPLHAGTLGGGIALSSQLVDRGQAITRATPVLQGVLSWTTPDGWALGLSASAQARSPGGMVEAMGQVAHYWTLSDDWSMQASAIYYKYPMRSRFFDRGEGGLHWTYRDVLTFGVSATRFTHADHERTRPGADATFHWPLTEELSLSVGAGVAKSYFDPYPYYRYGHAGLAWTRGAWRMELDRVAADVKTPRYWRSRSPEAEPWVATVLWSF